MSERTERDFLHDLANPLATAFLVLETLRDQGSEGEENAAQVEKLAQQLARMQSLLQERRKALIRSA